MQSAMWSRLASRITPVFTRSSSQALLPRSSGSNTTTITNLNSTSIIPIQIRTVKTTAVRNDLMEFFDVKKNLGEREVKAGRAWKIDELRLKSNTDLHKLWYILLKERNMLMTMEEDAKTECRIFPNPERTDKVEESMANLEEVVRERNRAYYMLETGTTGEQSGEEFENWLGLPEYRQYKEYPVPKEANRNWHIERAEEPQSSTAEKHKFYKMLREKQRKQLNKHKRRMLFEIHEHLRLFPNMDMDALKEKYAEYVPPEEIDRIVERKKSRIYENSTIPRERAVWRNAYVRGRHTTWKQYYNLE